MASPLVVVVGSVNVDLTFSCKSFPKPGETVQGDYRMGVGGKGANQAIASHRAGGYTRFLGAVGDDHMASVVRDFLSKENLPHHLVCLPGEATGVAGIKVNEVGMKTIIAALGANLAIQVDDLPADWLSDASVVCCQNEINPQVTQFVLRKAFESAVHTVYKAAPMDRDLVMELLPFCTSLVVNELQYEALTGFTAELDDQQLVHEGLQSIGARSVILTLGKRGTFVSTPERYTWFPCLENIHVVDTVGSGDAFTGVFAAAMGEFNGNLFEAARFANVAANLSVSKYGAAQSMPTRDQINAAMDQPLV